MGLGFEPQLGCADQHDRAYHSDDPVVAAASPGIGRILAMRLGDAFQGIASHLRQMRNLFQLLLNVAGDLRRGEALAHPLFQIGVGGGPEIPGRGELATQSFDISHGLLAMVHVRMDLL